jgi:predicted O-methyltransferase YrrM
MSALDERLQNIRALNNTKSMLHPDVLALLHELARVTRGSVLELGAYVGGATIAVSAGLEGHRRFVSVEIGGRHDHPTHESSDIFGDLLRNLAEAHLDHRVKVLNADAHLPETFREIERGLDGRKIGLLMIDSDGRIDEDLALYKKLCRPDCVIVLDDYVSSDDASGLEHVYSGYNPDKSRTVKQTVDTLVSNGYLVEFGVYGWGTWFGRLSK